MNRTILRTITLIGLAATAGCASAPRAVQQQPDFARFRGAIAVEEIVLAPTVAAELPENDRNVLASKLRIALVSSLSGTATVREPGPGVLRLQVTVTAIDTTSPAVNAISSALVFVPLDRGSIAFEARFFDGTAAQPITWTAELRKGSPLDIKGNFRLYGHAISALEKWGESLGAALQET